MSDAHPLKTTLTDLIAGFCKGDPGRSVALFTEHGQVGLLAEAAAGHGVDAPGPERLGGRRDEAHHPGGRRRHAARLLFGHMSNAAAAEVGRRDLGGRQSERVDALVDAALAELRARGYEGLTVRNAARRAGVGAATAYTWFGSKDHLVAEVFWRRLDALPSRGGSRAS